MKLGLLFDGCTFGAAGDQKAIYDFLMRANDYVLPFPEPYRWAQLCRFAQAYTYPGDEDRFKIAFSSRAGGRPVLFLLDSAAEGIEAAGDRLSFGSGEDILDLHVADLEASKLVPNLGKVG